MTRFILLSLAALMTASAHAAAPFVRACAEPEVLILVAERLARAGIPQTLEASTVGQVPGVRSGFIECAVRVHAAIFDTPRYGAVPLDQVSVYRYTLRLGRNGVFVQPAATQDSWR